MNRPTLALILAALIAVGVATVSGQAPSKPQKSFLSVMTNDQLVVVKEVAGRFEISTFDEDMAVLSHKVIEVGPDYLVVAGIAEVTETRIPVYAIKSFVKFKAPK